MTDDKTTPRAKRYAILGAGRLGLGVAQILGSRHEHVKLWARRELQRRQVAEMCEVDVVDTVAEATHDADLVFLAVPAPDLFEVANAFGEVAQGNQIVLHGSRGVGADCELPHQAIRRASCVQKIGALGGPLYLEDLLAGHPLFAVVGSRFVEVIDAVRELCAGTPVKVHGCMDPVGVEVAGAMSNIAMVAAGMAEALSLGETARGVLLTHGLSDAERFGVAIGADLATFSGLAGVGDLIPRHVASTLRNARVGQLVVEGQTVEQAVAATTGCVEGVRSAREILARAEHLGIELSLVRAVDDVLQGRRPAREALDDVLQMDLYLGREAIAKSAR